jgi:ElaB/YqjD/DUF883 family membrane-anchored ribosome-binding protein
MEWEMSGQPGDGGSAVGEKVEQAKDVVSAQATTAAERGRGVVGEQLDQRSTQLGEQVGSASQTFRQVAEQSRAQGNQQQARMAEMAADRTDRFGAFLREADGERMLSEAEDFARRQPWVIAGAGLAIGFIVARALKASSGDRYQRRSATQFGTYQTAYSGQSAYGGRSGSSEQFTDRPPRWDEGNGEAATTRVDIGSTR